jgi:hypothetical protein
MTKTMWKGWPAALVLLAGNAAAAGGEIRFHGAIVTPTCQLAQAPGREGKIVPDCHPQAGRQAQTQVPVSLTQLRVPGARVEVSPVGPAGHPHGKLVTVSYL